MTRIARRLNTGSGAPPLVHQREIPVIPKSANRERIAENGRVFDWS